MIWKDRVLTQADVARLYHDPAQIYRPRTRQYFFAKAADTSRNATLAATLGALTSAAAGTVVVAGDLSQPLGALTSAATGTVLVVGDLAKTLGALTLAGTATAPVAGALAATLDPATLAAAGDVDVAGALAQTLGAATLAATGTVTVSAALAKTLDAATLAGTGTIIVAASLSSTLGAATLIATGTVPGIDAVLAATLGAVASAASGTVIASATLAQTLGAATVSAWVETSAAELNATLAAAILAATGTADKPEGVTAILGAATLAATGTVAVSGKLIIGDGKVLDLYGHWPLTEGSGTVANDISGADRDATLTSAAMWEIPTTGFVLDFNGTSEYLDFGSIANFERNQAFACFLWITTTVQGLFPDFIIANQGGGYAGSTFGWGLSTRYADDSRLQVLLIAQSLNDHLRVRSTVAINDGRPHRIGFTYDGSSTAAGLKLYVDGANVGEVLADTLDSGSILSSLPLLAGVHQPPPTLNLFTGRMRDLRIWSGPLTPQDVADDYALTAGPLADATVVATASLGFNAALAATLGAATSAATGTVIVAGALAATLSAAMLAGAGTVIASGALAETLRTATLAALGTVHDKCDIWAAGTAACSSAWAPARPPPVCDIWAAGTAACAPAGTWTPER